MTSITVVGAGAVGTNLATRLAEVGHTVRFAARNPDSDKVQAARAATGLDVGGLDQAPQGAEVVILAVPYGAVADTVAALGDVGDAILVDATNTVGSDLPEGAATIVDVIARANPDARIVKAFNTIGAEAFLHPEVDGTALFLPVAGDEGAVDTVAALAVDMGFDALPIGGRDTVLLLEGFAALWIHMAFRVGQGRDFGFAKLHR